MSCARLCLRIIASQAESRMVTNLWVPDIFGSSQAVCAWAARVSEQNHPARGHEARRRFRRRHRAPSVLPTTGPLSTVRTYQISGSEGLKRLTLSGDSAEAVRPKELQGASDRIRASTIRPLRMGHQPSGRAGRHPGSAIGAHYRHTTPEMAAHVVAAVEERLVVVLATAEAALDRQPW